MDALRTVTPLAETRASDFAQCLLEGLSRIPKEIPCKYFYDEEDVHGKVRKGWR